MIASDLGIHTQAVPYSVPIRIRAGKDHQRLCMRDVRELKAAGSRTLWHQDPFMPVMQQLPTYGRKD